MKTHNPFRILALAASSAATMIFLAGCQDETLVFVEDNPPAVPSGVYTVTGDERVEIFWNPVRQEDVAGYGVYRSSTLEGPYQRIATIERSLADSHTDFNVTNGVTYFYAVDAFDFAGNESELSYENAFDTPRPAGFNVTIFARQEIQGSSGIDFSDWDRTTFVTGWTANDTDVYFQRVGTVLFARGTVINSVWNDIQDLGFTSSMDEVSWAPAEGWSVAPNGVELIEGHTYVVWTHDEFFAKFRVTQVLGPDIAPTGAVIDWAYQIDPGNPELSPQYGGIS